jgi:hypothetical protein
MNAAQASAMQALGAPHLVKFGVQSRADIIDGLGLYHTVARSRVGTVRDDRVRQGSAGVYLEAESRWRPWLRTVLGTRGDVYAFDVTSDVPANSGTRRR